MAVTRIPPLFCLLKEKFFPQCVLNGLVDGNDNKPHSEYEAADQRKSRPVEAGMKVEGLCNQKLKQHHIKSVRYQCSAEDVQVTPADIVA